MSEGGSSAKKSRGGPAEMLADLNAEMAVLGSLMRATPEQCDQILQACDGEWFSVGAHTVLWGLFAEFVDRGDALDVLTLERALKDRGEIDDTGGRQKLDSVANFVPTAGNWRAYVETVEDFYKRRQVRQAGAQMQELPFDREMSVEEVVEAAEGCMTSLREERGDGAVDSRQLAIEVIDGIEAKVANRGRIIGVPTGFQDIDRTLLGLGEGRLMFVGGRPGMGKTTMVCCMAERTCVRPPEVNPYGEPIPGLFLSMEMGRAEVGEGMVCGLAGVLLQKRGIGGFNLQKLRLGFLSKPELQAINEASQLYAKAPLLWDDQGDLNIGDVKAKVRLNVKRHGTRVVFVDYVQLIKPLSKLGQREERLGIAEVCEQLKSLAKQTGVVIVALAQTVRGSEDNPGKKPTLRDFDGSSAIEKNADYAGFIHRPAYVRPWFALGDEKRGFYIDRARKDYMDPGWDWRESWLEVFGTLPGSNFFDTDEEARAKVLERMGQRCYECEAEFLLRKNRFGPCGDVPLKFVPPLKRFESLTEKLFSNNDEERQPETLES